MQNLSEIVGTNLSALRKEKGLTQSQLAEILHYSDKSISKWELGYSIPSVDVLKEFADFYGVTIDFLITEQKEEALHEVVEKMEKPKDPKYVNKAVSIALLNLAVILIATVIYIAAVIKERQGPIWTSFVWAAPACCFVSLVASRFFYKNNIAFAVLFSCLMWTLITAICIHYQFVMDEPIWFILAVCIPVQAIIILLIFIRKQK